MILDVVVLLGVDQLRFATNEKGVRDLSARREIRTWAYWGVYGAIGGGSARVEEQRATIKRGRRKVEKKERKTQEEGKREQSLVHSRGVEANAGGLDQIWWVGEAVRFVPFSGDKTDPVVAMHAVLQIVNWATIGTEDDLSSSTDANSRVDPFTWAGSWVAYTRCLFLPVHEVGPCEPPRPSAGPR